MARRGSFGRSGATQNLSMLVYQLLKDQMGSELSAILDAYKNNMRAGKFASQFNGQNIDGQYVLDYYGDMLAGFPPGSTEYMSLKSQIDTFKEQYQNDIQDLVVNSMNNGTQIDFGLLGADFVNKGISEVGLADIKGWADSQIARLEETNDLVRIDQIKQTLFAAEFNVANDGIAAAVTAKDRTYHSYTKWLGGQLQSALDAGFTKESEFYRSILTQWSKAKAAQDDFDMQVAGERVDGAISGALKQVDEAARVILEKYMSDGGAMSGQVTDLWASIPEGSRSPYYDMLKLAGEQKDSEQFGGLYESIMNSSGIENLSQMFAEASIESNAALSEILSNGIKGLSPADRTKYIVLLNKLKGAGVSFVSKTGIEFSSNAAKLVIDELDTKLRDSGMSFGADASGRLTGVGGHPDAVIAALSSIAPTLDKMGNTSYPWLSDISKGQIGVDFVSSSFAEMDTNGDRKLDIAEMKAGFLKGDTTMAEIESELTVIMNNMATEDMPNSRISPGSLVRGLVDAAWGQYALENGAIAMITSTGAVKVTDVNNAQVGNEELIPTIIDVGGKKSVAYAQPVSIYEQTQGEAAGPLGEGRTNGISISVYHQPGNFNGSGNLGKTDAMVILKGNFRDASGATSQQAFTLTYDQFSKVMQAKGISIDASSFDNPTQDNGGALMLSFDAATATSTSWTNMFNTADPENYIGLMKYNDPTNTKTFGQPVLSGFDIEASRFSGFTNQIGDVNAFLTSALGDKSKILALAGDISKNKGKTTIDTDDLLDAALKINPGIVTNLSYKTVKDALSKTSSWTTALQQQYPTVPVAKPSVWQPGNTMPVSGGGIRPYETPAGNFTPPGGVPGGTGIPKDIPKPDGSSFIDNAGKFLGEVFKQRPGMVGSSAIPSGTGIPKDIKFKPSPVAGIKVDNPFASASQPKATDPNRRT